MREVYAKYGVAMYLAQVIEHGLANFFLYAAAFTGVLTEAAQIDAVLDEMFSKSMGEQMRHVLAVIEFSEDHVVRLNQARERRNMLAHNYWRVRIGKTLTEVGRNEMLSELDAICEEFDALNTEMEMMAMAVMGLHGITPEMHQAEVERVKSEFREASA
jgi:hypothetical protein